MPQLFRVSVKLKETDKRKNANVYRSIVLAETLDEAKALAVAEWASPETSKYQFNTLDRIADVWGHDMSTLVYNCDIYGEKDKTEHPETVPTLERVRAAQAVLRAYEKAHEAEAAPEGVVVLPGGVVLTPDGVKVKG